MNQAIKIIDEMIDTLDIIYADSSEDGEIRRIYNAMKGILGEAKTRISSPPSDTQWIESLQRYVDEGGIFKDDEGDYVKYEDVLKLLK